MLAALTDAIVKAAGGDPVLAVLLLVISVETALLGWVVRLVLTGKLVPGVDRDYWREMALEEQRQKRELMVTAQVARGVMMALPVDAPPDDS